MYLLFSSFNNINWCFFKVWIEVNSMVTFVIRIIGYLRSLKKFQFTNNSPGVYQRFWGPYLSVGLCQCYLYFCWAFIINGTTEYSPGSPYINWWKIKMTWNTECIFFLGILKITFMLLGYSTKMNYFLNYCSTCTTLCNVFFLYSQE